MIVISKNSGFGWRLQEILVGSGSCEKCRSCIIYTESCNLSIPVSVFGSERPLIMRWAPKPEISPQMTPHPSGSCSSSPPPLIFIKCLEETRRSAAVLPMTRVVWWSIQAGEETWGADVPDQFKRLSPQRGWFGSSVFSSSRISHPRDEGGWRRRPRAKLLLDLSSRQEENRRFTVSDSNVGVWLDQSGVSEQFTCSELQRPDADCRRCFPLVNAECKGPFSLLGSRHNHTCFKN